MNADYTAEIQQASALLAGAILAREAEIESKARELDGGVKELLRLVGKGTMTQVYQALSGRVAARTAEAGIPVNRRDTVEFTTVFGPVEVPSPYHWNSQTRASARPVQDEFGITHQGRSKAVERAFTDFGAEKSFGRAATMFQEHYGFEVGRTTLLRVVEENARAAEAFVEQRLRATRIDYEQPLAIRPGADLLIVELDGCELRTGKLVPLSGGVRTLVRGNKKRQRQEEWRDTRLALVRGPDEVEKTFVGKMASYDEVTEQLFSAAVGHGLSSRTHVIGIADGGNGLREALVAKFPGMRFILDQPHLIGHFNETAEALGLAGDERDRWVRERLDLLDKGDAASALRLLREQLATSGNDRLRRFVDYVDKFRDATHYERYRNEGLPCGSGEIESAHRYIPQERLKIAGACWHPDTINPMLALRIARANGWWTDFWSQRTMSIKKRGRKGRPPRRPTPTLSRSGQASPGVPARSEARTGTPT